VLWEQPAQHINLKRSLDTSFRSDECSSSTSLPPLSFLQFCFPSSFALEGFFME
jgi:hypothetical protein